MRRGGIAGAGAGAGADSFDYWDADLSTPLRAIQDFVDVLDRNPACDVLLGSRVKLIGRATTRRAIRHYPGRVFATAVSLTLRLPVYDTQCSAKLFRATPEIIGLFAEPLVSRWTFDVELLVRLIHRRYRDRGGTGHGTSRRVRRL